MSLPTQGFFESDDDYRERISLEADEQTIENATGEAPSQGFFEGDDDYRERIRLEADEATIEDVTEEEPSQGFFEKDDDYVERITLEADERIIEDLGEEAPSQGFFESDSAYRERIAIEADECTIEDATGDAPSQGFFESDDDYHDRISKEADEHRADDGDEGGGGCFLTTACVNFMGLPDDCPELTVLRAFRDGVVRHRPGGETLISQYYLIAPRIVSTLEGSKYRVEVLRYIWCVVQRAISAIRAGDDERAFREYSDMVERLQREVL